MVSCKNSEASPAFSERKKPDGRTQNKSYLYLPGLRTENQDSKRKGKNRNRLSKMSYKVCKEELRCLDM